MGRDRDRNRTKYKPHRHSKHSKHRHSQISHHSHHQHVHHDYNEYDSDYSPNKLSVKRRGLNINLNATPIESLAKNTKKARSKPAPNTMDITRNSDKSYNFVSTHYNKKRKSRSRSSRFKKRISAPIILPTSTTPSLSTISGSVTANISHNTPNTPYYNNYSNGDGVKHKKKSKKTKKKKTETTNTNLPNLSTLEETIIEKEKKDNNSSSSSSNLDESDEYLDETEINAMMRSCRRISKSRPRAYSKTRRISQKLFGLMESISLDNNNISKKKEM